MIHSDYKSVWNALADTEEHAKLNVGGTTDEAELSKSAAHTLQVLGATVGVRSTDTFVEIGCGVGRVGAVLAPRVAAWIGCDVSGAMVEHAARRLAAFPNVRTVETNGHDLRPLEDACADVVYCTVVFMHLETWDRFGLLTEARRVLRPGGRVYCDAIDLATDRGWAIFEQARAVPPALRPQHLSRCCTHDEIRTLLIRAGFHDVRTETRDLWVQGWGRV